MSSRDPDTLVLLIDDDPALGTVLQALLGRKGIASVHVTSAEAAFPVIERRPVDLAIVDLHMPGMDGLMFVELARRRYPDLPVVVLTAHGSIQLAVRALQGGAADFLEKPFDSDQLLTTISNRIAQKRVDAHHGSPGSSIVGDSPAVATLLERITRAASSDATVLIRGESGTGKELVAREIHRQSRRNAGPFVSAHCSAIPEALLESELFGHCRGAFTGAHRDRQGRVELARSGTLFFDELGDISGLTQTKLLRLIQERTFERVGEVAARQADVRFIAATHRPLEEMVQSGAFREDLYYRLNVVPIQVPPLRERRQDIAPLVAHFEADISAAQSLPRRAFTPEAVALMALHSWPGNVRELRNLVERLVVLAEAELIGEEQVRAELSVPPKVAGARHSTPPPRRIELDSLKITEMLEKTGQNRALAARLLGVSRRTLYNRLREFGLD
jgi:DNA-binding NtrC family response regulator